MFLKNIIRFLILVITLSFFQSSFAYYENYPPYKFKQGPYESLKMESLSDNEIPLTITNSSDYWPLHNFYKVDIDSNGLEDFIVLSFSGTGTLIGYVEIYLQEKGGYYQRISYEGSGIGTEDFVDLNKDGKTEVIITGVYQAHMHTYLSYDVYEFKNYRLVNADHKFKDFPKFVWMTYKSNDQDTTHLGVKEKRRHIKQKNGSIRSVELENIKYRMDKIILEPK